MKQKVVSFKVDPDVEELLSRITNKSEFIRNSVLKQMECICPLCSGTGILNMKQKKHWDNLKKDHSISRCKSCDELYIKCEHP